MKAVLGFVVLLLTVVVWLYFDKRLLRRQVEVVFKDRSHLSDDEFFATYYKESGIPKNIVSGVRWVLGDELQVDISRVIPTDDLAGNLHFLLTSDSMIDVAIVEGLEKRFGITISDQEAERTRTFHDIINYVHGKTVTA